MVELFVNGYLATATLIARTLVVNVTVAVLLVTFFTRHSVLELIIKSPVRTALYFSYLHLGERLTVAVYLVVPDLGLVVHHTNFLGATLAHHRGCNRSC